MFCYRAKTFCPVRDCANTECEHYFDEGKYEKACARVGFKMRVDWGGETPDSCPLKRPDRGAAIRTGIRRKNKALCRAIEGMPL